MVRRAPVVASCFAQTVEFQFLDLAPCGIFPRVKIDRQAVVLAALTQLVNHALCLEIGRLTGRVIIIVQWRLDVETHGIDDVAAINDSLSLSKKTVDSLSPAQTHIV